MPSPLFTVIVPTYGRPQYLPEGVASVLAQTVTDFECIVVDDGSPEPAELPFSDPRVRLVRRQQNGGPSAARNTGLAQARGRFVAFLDDDDVFRPDRLDIALEGLRQAPVSICWSRFLHAGSAGRSRTLEGDVHDVILDATTPHLGATALRTGLAPRFDERFRANQDLDWWLRLTALTNVATVARVGYLVRKHDGPRHGNGVEARLQASQQLMRKHSGYFAAHPRAAAFRYKRIGLMARSLGDNTLARRAFVQSLRMHPEAKCVWHLLRTLNASSAPGKALRVTPPDQVDPVVRLPSS